MFDLREGRVRRQLRKAPRLPRRVHDDAFSRLCDATVQREIERLIHNCRRHSPGERIGCLLSRVSAITEFNFVEIQAQVVSLPRQSQKKILQSEIVKDHDAGAHLHRLKHPGVITMIVAQVIEHGIEFTEPAQVRRLASIIQHFETRSEFTVHRLKAINEQSDLRTFGQVRQKLLTVIGDSRSLRC